MREGVRDREEVREGREGGRGWGDGGWETGREGGRESELARECVEKGRRARGCSVLQRVKEQETPR